jgi:membrane protease YdiL (CAAX protease family)
LTATRHPWPCFLFLLPLLAAYEGGMVWLAGTQAESMRNGADTWLHWGLEAMGLGELYWVPGLVAVALLVWSWLRRWDRPLDAIGVCMGMAVESLAFALGLWTLSRSLGPLLDRLGIPLAQGTPAIDPAAVKIIMFVGAGIYEEVLFRLVLFTSLRGLLRFLNVGAFEAVVMATAASALLFAAAHHVGPHGEPFAGYVFVFRALAGLYFTLLFQLRGFGIAVGAHACYDVLVGTVMV